MLKLAFRNSDTFSFSFSYSARTRTAYGRTNQQTTCPLLLCSRENNRILMMSRNRSRLRAAAMPPSLSLRGSVRQKLELERSISVQLLPELSAISMDLCKHSGDHSSLALAGISGKTGIIMFFNERTKCKPLKRL